MLWLQRLPSAVVGRISEFETCPSNLCVDDLLSDNQVWSILVAPWLSRLERSVVDSAASSGTRAECPNPSQIRKPVDTRHIRALRRAFRVRCATDPAPLASMTWCLPRRCRATVLRCVRLLTYSGLNALRTPTRLALGLANLSTSTIWPRGYWR